MHSLLLTSTYADGVFQLATYLLPGLVAVMVFYAFTAHKQSTLFGQIIYAIIFATVVNGIFSFLDGWIIFQLQKLEFEWNPDMLSYSFLFMRTVTGCAIGVIWVGVINSDLLHKIARFFRLTKRTGYPSVFYQMLYSNKKYVILHLKNGQRIAGFPELFPSSLGEGHIGLVEYRWLDDDTKKNQELEYLIMINMDDVQMIEVGYDQK